MSLTTQLLLVAVAVCLCLSEGAADERVARNSKQQRPTRGFKSLDMMTARGFGKRARPSARTEPYDLENFWEMLEASPEREGHETNDDKMLESIPVDLLVNEIVNNPDFARSVVRQFIDINQDGQLSSDELLRTVA